MHAEERQGAEEQARHLSAPGMYTSDARQGGGERLHPGVVLLYMPVALTCLPCSWARASRRRRLAWGTCRPRDFSLMCRTTADAIQWVLSQDGGVEGAEGGWLPGALLLRTSADCCAFSRTCGNRSSATIVGYDRRLRVSVLCLGATRRRPASSRFSDVVSDTYLLLLSMADNLIG